MTLKTNLKRYFIKMRIIVFVIGIITLTSCSNVNKVKIKGTLSNCKDQILYFEEVDVYNVKTIDSLIIKNNGRFSFSVETKLPRFYQLRTSDKFISLLLEPGEKGIISGDISNLSQTLTIDGSEGSLIIQDLLNKSAGTRLKLDSISMIYDNTNDGLKKKNMEEEYLRIIEDHRKYLIGFILNNCTSLASIMALYQEIQPQTYLLNKTRDIQFYKIVRDSLKIRYPKSKHVIVLDKNTNKLIQEYKTNKILSSIKPGDFGLPEIALPDIKGDTIKLLSLKGNYVLLSFWASWNKQSIAENLNLKSVYNKYNKKGFKIYQVSFDKSIADWKKAINFDELPWISVNDSTFPNSKVALTYNVQNIPYNYLLDKDMENIIAKNIKSKELNNKLSDLFN